NRRLALAKTFINGSPAIALLVENEGTAAHREALDYKSQAPSPVDVIVVGQAQSSNPSEAINPPHVPALAPASSISHHNGWAGSLGAFVRFRSSASDIMLSGFTSAAHVLDSPDDERRVYSPGRPDRDPDIIRMVGRVEKCIGLASYRHLDDPANI